MAYPDKYNRQFSFGDDEAEHPSDKTPGDQLDAEYDALKITTDAIIESLKLIQRSDGRLQNGSVGRSQLSAGLQVGVEPARAWVTGTVYAIGDAVTEDNGLYTCLAAHTAGTFATDLTAGKWELLANFSVTGVAPGSITSTELANGAAIEGKIGANAVSTGKIQDLAVTEGKLGAASVATAKIQDLAVTTGKIAARAVTAAKMPAVTSARLLGRVSSGSGDYEEISLGDGLVFDGSTLKLDYASQGEAQAQTSHNTTHVMTPLRVWQMILSIFPIGTPLHWPTTTAPAGWWACDGAVKPRTGDGAALFAVIGTTFNTGGESGSEFRLPNEEGLARRGWISGGSRDSGRVFGSYQADELKAHTHSIFDTLSNAALTTAAARTMTPGLTGVSGSTGGSETRMKNIAYLPIIRYR